MLSFPGFLVLRALLSCCFLHHDVSVHVSDMRGCVQDDAFGDPEVWGLDDALVASMGAQMDGQHEEEESLDEASIEASMEDDEDSDMEDIEGDADSPAAGPAGRPEVEGSHQGACCILCRLIVCQNILWVTLAV